MVTKSQVKYIQSLGQKKFRDEAGEFIAEGPKIINELLGNNHIPLSHLFATKDWIDQHQSSISLYEGRVETITSSELERISFLTTPHQVLGIFKKPAVPASITISNGIVLMLDGIQDPGNMGTILRIADWFGVKQIICSPDCADAFAPKVVQSTMGSVARVAVLYTDLLTFIKLHKGVDLFAATLYGKAPATIGHIKKGIIVIGNESKGINEEIIKIASQQVTIPRLGKAESLNAAVATGIILSHLAG